MAKTTTAKELLMELRNDLLEKGVKPIHTKAGDFLVMDISRRLWEVLKKEIGVGTSAATIKFPLDLAAMLGFAQGSKFTLEVQSNPADEAKFEYLKNFAIKRPFDNPAFNDEVHIMGADTKMSASMQTGTCPFEGLVAIMCGDVALCVYED